MTRHVSRLWLRVAVALLVCLPWGTTVAQAQQTPAQTDAIQLLGLTADSAKPADPNSPIRFHATMSYQLASAPSGFLLVFLFEDGVSSSTQQSTQGHAVKAGSGKVVVEATYQPPTGVGSVTVLVGLFKDKDTLLAWSGTDPISLAPWPGRAAFAGAMAARATGDYARSVGDLSTAIKAAPENGTYYYWRADGELRLGQYDDALRDYSRSLEIQPQDRASRAGRGVALLWKGDWQGALDELNAVVGQSDPADRVAAWAKRARGVAFAALGQAQPAIDDLQSYLALVPSAPDRADVEAWIGDLQAGGVPDAIMLQAPAGAP